MSSSLLGLGRRRTDPRWRRGRRAAAIVAAAIVGLLPTVGSATTEPAAPDYGDTAIALSWIKNYEFAGYFLADRNGYYADAGFDSVEILAGGGQTNSWDSVLANNALFGLASDLTGVSSSILQGSDLVVIGAQYVRSPVGIVSLAENPISSVEDLEGTTMGVDANGRLAMLALLEANGLPEDYLTFVAVPNGIDPLMNGDVDALLGFLTNYPLAVNDAGGQSVVLSFSDAGFGQVGDAVVVTRETLETRRDELKALMIAAIRGWNDALADTELVVDVAMEYGAENDLEESLQTASAGVQPTFMLTPDTVVNGIFTVTGALADETINSLAASGIEITKDQLFDLTLLEEVYAEHPDLVPGFEVPES